MALTTILDDFYERDSYMYGGGWISHENGVRHGEVRVINGVLSQAWNITRRRLFGKDQVMWKNVEPQELRKVDPPTGYIQSGKRD